MIYNSLNRHSCLVEVFDGAAGVLAIEVLEEHVDLLSKLLIRVIEEGELLTLLVVGVSLGDCVDAAFGGGEGLVGVRGPHVEQFDVAVAPAVLAEGVVDVGGLADLDVHYFEARVLQVRNPDRVDNFLHRHVLRDWSLEVYLILILHLAICRLEADDSQA